MDARFTVGVLGATSPAGTQALRLLAERRIDVVAFSRERPDSVSGAIRWVNLASLDPTKLVEELGSIALWIVFSHIWVIPEHFALLTSLRANRIVCTSSTSRFTKVESSDPYEEQIVKKLVRGERALIEWAEREAIGWTILRPTLIYGRSKDKNVSEIVRIIKRFGFFPLFGEASGLRQPIHVDDVATACIQAVVSNTAINKAYNLSGAEQLTYKEMVSRVFLAMGRRPRLIKINLKLFRCALSFLRMIPRYQNWNAEMVLRMNQDMVFDHNEARQDFSFSPRHFILQDVDVQG